MALKSVLFVILIVAGCFTAVWCVLRLTKVVTDPNQPLAVGVVAILAATAGMLPLVRSRNSDPGMMLQKAMAGTMLHMFVAAALSIAVITVLPHLERSSAGHAGRQIHGQRMSMILWILGGYWLSLLAVVWRSRQLIVKASLMQQEQAGANRVGTLLTAPTSVAKVN